MRRRALLRALGLAAVAALVLAAPAAAATIADADDTAGSLDVRKVTATSTASSVKVTVTTWGSWSSSVLASAKNRLVVLFDSDLDGTAEYRGRIVESGGALVVLLSGQGNNYEPLPVQRASGKKLSFTIPTDVMGAQGADLQVAVTSRYRDSGSCVVACKDRAPDSGWLLVPAP